VLKGGLKEKVVIEMRRKYIQRLFEWSVFMASMEIQDYLQLHPSGIEFIALQMENLIAKC
jgi:hypothetical protein